MWVRGCMTTLMWRRACRSCRTAITPINRHPIRTSNAKIIWSGNKRTATSTLTGRRLNTSEEDNTSGSRELACTAGVCEVVDAAECRLSQRKKHIPCGNRERGWVQYNRLGTTPAMKSGERSLIEVKISDEMLLAGRRKATEMGLLHNSILRGGGSVAGFLGEQIVL